MQKASKSSCKLWQMWMGYLSVTHWFLTRLWRGWGSAAEHWEKDQLLSWVSFSSLWHFPSLTLPCCLPFVNLFIMDSVPLIFILLHAIIDYLIRTTLAVLGHFSPFKLELRQRYCSQQIPKGCYGRWKCSHTWILKNFLCHCFAPGRRVGWKASSFILNLTRTRVGVPRDLTLTGLLSNFFNEEEFLFQPCCKQKTAAVNALSGKGLRMRYGLTEVKGKTSIISTPFFPPPQFLWQLCWWKVASSQISCTLQLLFVNSGRGRSVTGLHNNGWF